jgi:hypothetical protein
MMGYPSEGVLRFDRCAPDGEILHPYAGHKDRKQWIGRLYLAVPQAFLETSEREFIALPIATAADVRERANRQSI